MFFLPFLLLAGAASVYSGVQAGKQAKAQNAANDIQRQQNDLSNARAKRDAIREARIARASAQQTGENQGVASSSASLGGVGSIATQLADNVSFLDAYGIMSDQASVQLGKANTFGARAQMGQSISSAAMTGAANSSSIEASFNKIFGK